jgi:DNA repair photolyase
MADYIQAKSILCKLKRAPDPYFGITYNMNLYRGCQHQCIYCDSRSTVYQLGDLSHIRIKRNAISLLEKELRAKKNRATIGTGSMNDPYMPLEDKEKLTRRALQKIAHYRFPIHVTTKSERVTRDVDLLQEISRIYTAVSFTITTPNDTLSAIIEPGATLSTKRFAAMETMAKHGLYTGLILTPVLPFITDTKESISELLKRAAGAGAKYVLCWMGMTQRDGQREYFYRQMDKHFPGLRNQYVLTFKKNYECASPNAKELYSFFMEQCSKLALPRRMQFYHPNGADQLTLFS